MEEYDLLILFSGGADSVLLLELALKLGKKPYCLLINYEQLHQAELVYARNYLRSKNINWQMSSIKGLNLRSGLTTSGASGLYEGTNEFYVPGRNTMFLSIALSIAENKDISEIWMGANYSDGENLFPDCTQEYIIKINELFKIATSKEIKVYAPLLGISKEYVFEALDLFDVNRDNLFSGYGDLENLDKGGTQIR